MSAINKKMPHTGGRQCGARKKVLPRIPEDSISKNTASDKPKKVNMVSSPLMLVARVLFWVSAFMFLYSALRVDSSSLSLLAGLGRMTMWAMLAAIGVLGFEKAKINLLRRLSKRG